jgi:hypothetical protein
MRPPVLKYKINPDALAPKTATPSSAVFTATREITDSDGDLVLISGLRFDRWKKSGCPVLFGHGENPLPVGHCRKKDGSPDVWISGDRLMARVHWDLDDPAAVHIARKVAAGFIKGASIAFIPHAFEPNHETKGRQYRQDGPGGRVYTSASISELSVVVVPANEDAVLADAPLLTKKSLQRACRRCARKGSQADMEPSVTTNLIDRSGTAKGEAPMEPPTQTTAPPRLSREVLTRLRKHYDQVDEYLQHILPHLDHPQLERALSSFYRSHGTLPSKAIDELWQAHCPDDDMDEIARALFPDLNKAADEFESGEAGMVGSGAIPPDDEPYEQAKTPRRDKQCSRAVVDRANQLALKVAQLTGVRVPTVPVY